MGRFDKLTKKQANECVAYSIAFGMLMGVVFGSSIDRVGLGIVLGMAIGVGVGAWFMTKRVPDEPVDPKYVDRVALEVVGSAVHSGRPPSVRRA